MPISALHKHHSTVNQSWTWIGSISGLDQDFQEALWIRLDSVA